MNVLLEVAREFVCDFVVVVTFWAGVYIVRKQMKAINGRYF